MTTSDQSRKQKIHLATDHAGYDLKQAILAWFLEESDYEVIDHGAFELDESDDYPDFIKKAARAVSEESPEAGDLSRASMASRGIVFGGSGQGEDMVADKFENVRSAVYYGGPLEIVKLSREHNDANVLSIGARFVSEDEAKAAIKLWLETPFSGDERHVRRIDKIEHHE